MKKTIAFLLLLLFLLPLTLAVEFESFKTSDSFAKGETFLTKFSGNFIDQPTEANIFFYRGHVKIPIVFEMEKISGEFYIYALLTGKNSGNYSVSVENVRYMNGTEISEENVVQNFTITDETADFSLDPGFLKTSKDFSLSVQNLKSAPITIQVGTTGNLQSVNSINVLSGEIKNIDFEILIESGVETVVLDSENTNYSIPIFIESASEIISEGEKSFRFEPETVEVPIPTNSDAKRIVYLINTGEETIDDIALSLSPLLENYVTLSPETINDLDVNTTEKIEISIISDLEEAILEGNLIASAENLTASMTLILNFIKDFKPTEEEKEEQVLTTTCLELEGEICPSSHECSEDPAFVKDGKCCLGICEEVDEGSSSGKIIGWLIVIILVILVFWFFKRKYRGVKSKVDLFRIARGKR